MADAVFTGILSTIMFRQRMEQESDLYLRLTGIVVINTLLLPAVIHH